MTQYIRNCFGQFKNVHGDSSDEASEEVEVKPAPKKNPRSKWRFVGVPRMKSAQGTGAKKPARKKKGMGGEMDKLKWAAYLHSVWVTDPEAGQKQEKLMLKVEKQKELPADPDTIGKIGQKLYMVDISRCKLTEIPDNLDGGQGSQSGLRVVQFPMNLIDRIPLTLGQCSELESIGLEHNKLKNIPSALFNVFKRLKVLNIGHNEIEILPLDFGSGLQSLEYLDASHNKLSALPENLLRCREIKSLLVTHNSLSELPAQLGELQQLERLFVSFNRISKLPASLHRCTRLKRLRVIENQLRELPREFLWFWYDFNALKRTWLQSQGKPCEFGDRDLTAAEREEDAHLRATLTLEDDGEESELVQKSLLELLVDRNPLVLPPITAFEFGLKNAFAVFNEALIMQAQRGTELALLSSPEKALASPEKYVPGAGGNAPDREDSDSDSDAERRPLLEDTAEIDEPEYNPKLLGAEGYYFSLFEDDVEGDGKPPGSRAMTAEERAEIRSKESALLWQKKNWSRDAEAAQTVCTTDFDVQFCLFVCATKPLYDTCYTLFDRADGAGGDDDKAPGADGGDPDDPLYSLKSGGVITHAAWQTFCQKMPLKLEQDVVDNMWTLLTSLSPEAREEPERAKVDRPTFIAAWHIHDLDPKDTWIERIAKVLRLEYYQMNLDDVAQRLHAKLLASVELPERFSGLPLLEGERILTAKYVRPDLVKLYSSGERDPDATSTVTGVSSGRVRASILNSPERSAGGKQKAHVFVTEEDLQQKAPEDDAMHSDPEVNSSDLSDSGSDDTASSLDAAEWAQEHAGKEATTEAEDEDEDDRDEDFKLGSQVQTEEDFKALLRKPLSFFKRVNKQGESIDDRPVVEVAKKKRLARKPARAARDPRFQTDVLDVRIALRQVFRSMSMAGFAKLVNYLVRALRLMQAATNTYCSYFHEDDPCFKPLCLSDTTQHLLHVMGFVKIDQTNWWVWPYLHMPYACTGKKIKNKSSAWGLAHIPANCGGVRAERLQDVITLCQHCQRGILDCHRKGRPFKGTF